MTITTATPADFPELLAECRKFASTLEYMHDYLPEDKDILDYFEYWAENHILLVAKDKSGEILGMICGEWYFHPFNQSKKVLYEHFWWVKEDKRARGAGIALLRAFLKSGASAHCIKVSLEHNSPVNDRFMAHFGLKLAEKTYIKEQ